MKLNSVTNRKFVCENISVQIQHFELFSYNRNDENVITNPAYFITNYIIIMPIRFNIYIYTYL